MNNRKHRGRQIRARVGRPMKYTAFINILEDNEMYSPATIALNGEKLGLFLEGGGVFPKTITGEALRDAKLRIRHTLARMSTNYGFPRTGDGLIILPGHGALPGWFGWRWKEVVK